MIGPAPAHRVLLDHVRHLACRLAHGAPCTRHGRFQGDRLLPEALAAHLEGRALHLERDQACHRDLDSAPALERREHPALRQRRVSLRRASDQRRDRDRDVAGNATRRPKKAR